MTDSTTTSRDFAPSWLRTSNHSPTPPFRSLANSGYKDRSISEDWDRSAGERRTPHNGVRYQGSNGDGRAESFLTNGHGKNRISSFEPEFFRRSNSVSNGSRGTNGYGGRGHNGIHQNLWNGRQKQENHFRHGNAFTNGFSFRDSGTNAKGISYSFVTSKTLKPLEAPTNVVLQQSDFPSLSPMKAELTAKSAQDTVWGNPPHLAKVVKRSLSSQPYLDGGGTILGPHYGKGFYQLTRDLKDVLNDDVISGVENGLIDDYNSQESSGEPPSVVTTDPQMDSVSANLCVEESPTENGSESEERCAWQITEVGREEHHISPSMISSSGSTGSVESIDSHQSHLSGTTAMMVEDLLDETITEEEKLQIMHALEEIKERTAYGSYYERVALTENPHQFRRYPYAFDVKGEEDDEDPDDRFLE